MLQNGLDRPDERTSRRKRQRSESASERFDEELLMTDVSQVFVARQAVLVEEELRQRNPRMDQLPEPSDEQLDERIEYDLESDDEQWLRCSASESVDNASRLTADELEVLIDRLEKHSYRLALAGSSNPYSEDSAGDTSCAICTAAWSYDTDQLIFCDGCDVVLHQRCYGVPLIPEGAWYCLRCRLLEDIFRDIPFAALLDSTADANAQHALTDSDSVFRCVLCPNQWIGGLKPTTDGNFAHVSCALWLPETGFIDTEAMEPICGVEDIPKARWNLRCIFCKETGPCIQCSEKNCTRAFHVTCAIAEGLSMKMHSGGDADADGGDRAGGDEASGGEGEGQCQGDAREVFCPAHSPGFVARRSRAAGAASTDWLQRRIALFKRRCPVDSLQPCSIPEFARLPGGLQKRLLDHWLNKRYKLHGMPLLRRFLPQSQPLVDIHVDDDRTPAEPGIRMSEALLRYCGPALSRLFTEQRKDDDYNDADYAQPTQLVQQIYGLRAIGSLLAIKSSMEAFLKVAGKVVEREKLKAQLLKQQLSIVGFVGSNMTMQHILDSLFRWDDMEIFHEPVSVDDVPDYADFIDSPMDFSTMRRKIADCDYACIDDFFDDLFLICSNAMIYNSDDTVYYEKAAELLQLVKAFQDAVDKEAVDGESRRRRSIRTSALRSRIEPSNRGSPHSPAQQRTVAASPPPVSHSPSHPSLTSRRSARLQQASPSSPLMLSLSPSPPATQPPSQRRPAVRVILDDDEKSPEPSIDRLLPLPSTRLQQSFRKKLAVLQSPPSQRLSISQDPPSSQLRL